jgi:hypothetical protein
MFFLILAACSKESQEIKNAMKNGNVTVSGNKFSIKNPLLEMELAKISGKMDQGFSDVVEVQKSLIEMYGQHETEIHTLRRRPV